MGACYAGGGVVAVSAHTQGPWDYGVRADGTIWLSIGDPATGPHHQGDLVATPDDARLITTAPELLEALKYARRMVKASECDIGFIDAAIAKAAGAAPVQAAPITLTPADRALAADIASVRKPLEVQK